MQWPWVSRALYQNVLEQLAKETRRAEAACEDLRLERAENRAMERHWSNQFLRKMNAYPQQPTREETADQPKFIPPPRYDPGELTAVIEEAMRLGVAEKEAKEMFAKEKGFDAKLIH
jgi:hypothetical protein